MKKIIDICTILLTTLMLSSCGMHTIIKDGNAYFEQNLNPNWNLPYIQINI